MVCSVNISGVTAKEPRLTAVPAGLIAELERRYALGPIEGVERLTGGYANDVYSLRSGESSVVLRIKYPPIHPTSIRWEHDVLRLLANRVPEIPAPLAARDGTTFFRHRRFAASVLPYLPGGPARADDADHAKEAARLLGRFHAAGAALEIAPRPAHPRLRDLPFPEAGGLPPRLADRDAGGPIPPAEDDLLVPLIRVKRVLEVMRAPTDRHVDWEEQRENLRAAEALR
jgi:Ser/Thr protein kinase RdoA (MazF antagonist)